MGWSWRKSIDFGAFRLNFGQKGIGITTGSKGFRTGVRSDGRKYTSISIPGTGIRYQGSKMSGLGLLAMLFGGALSGRPAPADQEYQGRPTRRTWRLRPAPSTESSDIGASASLINGLEELERELERKERRR